MPSLRFGRRRRRKSADDQRHADEDDHGLGRHQKRVGKRAGLPGRESGQRRSRGVELEKLGDDAEHKDREQDGSYDGMNREAAGISATGERLHVRPHPHAFNDRSYQL